MAVSWTEIFPDVDGEPVRASVDEVEGVATDVRADGRRRPSASSTSSNGSRRTRGRGSLEGEAADAFRDIVEKVDRLAGRPARRLRRRPRRPRRPPLAPRRPAQRGGIGAGPGADALGSPRGRRRAPCPASRSSHSQATADLDSLPPAGATRRPTPTARRRRTPSSRAAGCWPRRRARSTRRRTTCGRAAAEWDNLRGDEDDAQRPHRRPPRRHQPRRPVRPELVGVDPRVGVRAGHGPVGAGRPARPGRRRSPAGTGRRRCGRSASCSTACSMVIAVVALFTPLGPIVLALVAIKMAIEHHPVRHAVAEPGDRPDDRPGRRGLDAADLLGAAGDVALAGAGSGGLNGATPPSGLGATRRRTTSPRRPPTTRRDIVDDLPVIAVSRGRHPQSAQHVDDAQQAGHPDVADHRPRQAPRQRRRESLLGHPRQRKNLDRDEYPPAMFREGGTGSSVRHIDHSDNRGAGSSMGHQARRPARTALESDWWSPTDARTSHHSTLLNRSSDALGSRAPAVGRTRPRRRGAERAARRPQRLLRLQSALHVLPAGEAFVGASLESWNAPDGWRASYGSMAAGLFFFAEDVFGGQFAIRGEQVSRSTPRPARSRPTRRASRTGPTSCRPTTR